MAIKLTIAVREYCYSCNISCHPSEAITHQGKIYHKACLQRIVREIDKIRKQAISFVDLNGITQ